jgi:hypothetical protein
VSESDYQDEWDHHYVESVRRAAQRTYDVAAWQAPQVVYGVLAEELRRRGIEPESDAVFAGAMLISRGVKPAILRTAGE